MVIEIFGPPAAGKTTLAKGCKNQLRVELLTVLSRSERYGLCFRFLLARPFAFANLLAATLIQGLPSLTRTRHKLYRLTCHLAKGVKANKLHIKNPKRLLLVDEGMAQYFFSLYEREVSEKEAIRYINKFVQSDLLLYIFADEEVRKSRMHERGRVPRIHTGIDYKTWLKVVSANANLVNKLVSEKRFNSKVVVFDSSNTQSHEAVVSVYKLLATNK